MSHTLYFYPVRPQHNICLITLVICFHPNLSRTIWCRPAELQVEQALQVAKAANAQQRYRDGWQIISCTHSHQDQRCCCEAEPILTSEGLGATQTSGLHRNGPNLRQGERNRLEKDSWEGFIIILN